MSRFAGQCYYCRKPVMYKVLFGTLHVCMTEAERAVIDQQRSTGSLMQRLVRKHPFIKKLTQSMQKDTQSGSTQISNTQSQMHLYKILEEMLLVSTQYDWINNDSDLKFVVQKFGVEKILQAQLTSQAEQEKLLMEEE